MREVLEMLADATLERKSFTKGSFCGNRFLSMCLGARPGKTLSKSALS